VFECGVVIFGTFFNIIDFSNLPLLEPTDSKQFGCHLLSSRLASFPSVAAATATARSFGKAYGQNKEINLFLPTPNLFPS
jgi:hypothetical protein